MILACLQHPRYDAQLIWKLHSYSATCTFTRSHSPSCRVSFACFCRIWCNVFDVWWCASVF